MPVISSLDNTEIVNNYMRIQDSVISSRQAQMSSVVGPYHRQSENKSPYSSAKTPRTSQTQHSPIVLDTRNIGELERALREEVVANEE